MFTEEHRAIVGFLWDRDITPRVVVRQVSKSSNFMVYESTNTFDDLTQASGKTFTLDPDQDIIWIYLQGQEGFWDADNFHEGFGPFEDAGYQSMTLVVEPAN